MSRWAFWMMIISGLTFLATFLGIVWIRDTLVETRKAVKAADGAVSVTREIGEAQVRAYVNVSKLTVTPEPKSKRFYIAAIFSNSGQTPARNVSVQVGFFIEPEFSEDMWSQLEEPFFHGSLHVGETFHAKREISVDRGFRQEAIFEFLSKKKSVFVAHKITYRSVFGEVERVSFGASKLIEGVNKVWSFAVVPTKREST